MTSDDILVIKSNMMMSSEMLQKYFDYFLEAKKMGIVLIPFGFDVVIAPKDVEIKVEEFEEGDN